MHAAIVIAMMMAGVVTARVCTNVTIPVDITSRQGLFTEIPLDGNLDVVSLAQRLTQTSQNYTQFLLEDFQTLRGSYEISATYCRPDSNVGSTIQVLSHGIGFDKTYWDLSFNNYNYSYVEEAVNFGYSTLAIDRLGIGNSSHGDPLNEIQAQAEVEALNEVTTKLRNGDISQIDRSYDKVIHVGHSFGSIQTYWLSSLYPNNTDGIVLTGFSANANYLPFTIAGFNLHSARLNQPLRFGNLSGEGIRHATSKWKYGDPLLKGIQNLLSRVGADASTQDLWNEIASTELGNIITGYNDSVISLNYPAGYLTWSDFTANQYVFLYPGRYDTTLGILSETTKQPVTVGELLTLGSFPPSTQFCGPVLIFTGEHDTPFCGANCFASGGDSPNIPAEAKPLFPNASAFDAYIQPATAHGLNFHYNATAGYRVIQEWLETHGQPAS